MSTLQSVANFVNVEVPAPAPALSPLDAGWQAALNAFVNGAFPPAAMYQVFDALPPRVATPRNVAAIVSAVYADSYWKLTFVDQVLISADLMKALGVDQGTADNAAAYAVGAWRGMLVRGNTSDVGNPMPRGVQTASIDDVVNGTDPIADPKLLLTRWNSPFYNKVDGFKNYCYTRAQSINFGLPIAQAKARMFYTDQGFNQPPQSWQEMPVDGASQERFALMMNQTLDPQKQIQPTERALSNKAFTFLPAKGGHYCLLAIVSTEYFTNDPLSMSGNWNSLQWISSNGAAGWHNVDVPPARQARLKIYNQDPRPERFAVRAVCQNLPQGTKVTLSAEGNTLGVEPQAIFRTIQTVTAEGELAANYAGDITLTIDTPDGKALPANAAVEVQAHWIVPHGHRDYTKAVAHFGAYRAAQAEEPLELLLGSVRYASE